MKRYILILMPLCLSVTVLAQETYNFYFQKAPGSVSGNQVVQATPQSIQPATSSLQPVPPERAFMMP